jgi:hypothetical protein
MKTKLLRTCAVLFLFCTCSDSSLIAQDNMGNIWYFGRYAGIDFNSGTATAITNSAMETTEGCATICDHNGNLLFYTDGEDVYNNTHTIMPNGSGLFGGYSSTQSALIVPMPSNSHLFYVFTVDQIGGPHGFCYSIVDMTLDSGHGDVILKNTAIKNDVPLTEKLAGTMHLNGQDVWVAVHGLNSDMTYTYLVTASGINPPILSTLGSVHMHAAGQMKFSANGTKLATAIREDRLVDLFDFDNATGIISNAASGLLTYANYPYGLEFSLGNSKLYVTAQNDTAGHLYQFDMNAGNNAAILASQISVYNIQTVVGSISFWAMQLAPDGKIYVCFNNIGWIGALNSPELSGLGCSFNDSALYLGTFWNESEIGLPGHISNYNPILSNIHNPELQNSVSLFPDPFNATCTFLIPPEFSNGHSCSLSIFDSSGRIIFSAEMPGNHFEFSRDKLAEGVYYYQISSIDKFIQSGKMIIAD